MESLPSLESRRASSKRSTSSNRGSVQQLDDAVKDLFGQSKAGDQSRRPRGGLTVFELCNAVSQAELDARIEHPANDWRFNAIVGVTITVNAFMVGLETDVGRGDDIDDRWMYFLSDILFNAIFIVEMLFRLNLDGWLYFTDLWNLLDYHLIVVGFVDVCMSLFFQGGGDMKVLTAFRIIRMLRLVRNIRLLRIFRELWFLVKGMYDSIPTLGWITVLLMLATYVGSIYIVSSMGKDLHVHEMWVDAPVYIGNIPRCMVTLWQLVLLDRWGDDVARPILDQRSDMLIVLIPLIIICSFGILNVIVGVIVERTLQVVGENEGMVQKVVDQCEDALATSMAAEFQRVDKDGTRELDKDEFCDAIGQPAFRDKLRLLGLNIASVKELFYMLDSDQSGTISPEEFVKGIQRLKGSAKGKDLVQLTSFINRAVRRVKTLTLRAERLIDKADSVLGRLDRMWEVTSDELKERQAAVQRQEDLQRRMAEKRKILERLDRNANLKFPRLAVASREGGRPRGGEEVSRGGSPARQARFE